MKTKQQTKAKPIYKSICVCVLLSYSITSTLNNKYRQNIFIGKTQLNFF